jgi:Ca2+-transporting ATPase
VFPVIVIMVDPGDPKVMSRSPRDPNVPITNRAATTRWVLYGTVLLLSALVLLVFGRDTLSIDEPAPRRPCASSSSARHRTQRAP